MRPKRFSNSEAAINVGCAIAKANLTENGVFRAIHGVVKRDLEAGKYY